MTVETGNPAAGGGTGGDAGNEGQPRDGAGNQQPSGAQGSRNATDDAAARDGQDDLEKVEDPERLREMIREMRTHERRRNDGYNTLRTQHQQTQERLAAIERERNQSAPVEERLKQLEKDLEEERSKNVKIAQERKDERTNEGIRAAARKLNAIDPDDVARLLDRENLQIDEDGTPSNAETEVRAFLKKKPHLLRTSAGGGADGGNRGASGKGDATDMNALLRGQARSRRMSSTAND